MTALSKWLLTLSGPSYGTMFHREIVHLKDGSATRTVFKPREYNCYNAWDHSLTEDVLKRHPVAVWDSLQVLVIPGPGLFGRAITFHFAWGHDGMVAPTSIPEMALCFGYRTHTFGGAANFSEGDRTFVCPFNEGRTDVLKMRNLPLGGRAQFYIYYDESNFGSVQVAGDRLTLQITGNYQVYGIN
jgi:hypothetical protein